MQTCFFPLMFGGNYYIRGWASQNLVLNCQYVFRYVWLTVANFAGLYLGLTIFDMIYKFNMKLTRKYRI